MCWRDLHRSQESGSTIIIIALAMTALLGLTALVVDVGYLYIERSRLQNAADAAALAGARDLITGGHPYTTVADYVNYNGFRDADILN